jgi:hypothetical protein
MVPGSFSRALAVITGGYTDTAIRDLNVIVSSSTASCWGWYRSTSSNSISNLCMQYMLNMPVHTMHNIIMGGTITQRRSPLFPLPHSKPALLVLRLLHAHHVPSLALATFIRHPSSFAFDSLWEKGASNGPANHHPAVQARPAHSMQLIRHYYELLRKTLIASQLVRNYLGITSGLLQIFFIITTKSLSCHYYRWIHHYYSIASQLLHYC